MTESPEAQDRTVRVGASGLELDGGETLPLWSGAMHYWRVQRGHWGRCLDAVRALGFGIVESYVPWGVHEVARGRFDWTGERDLRAFLEEAGARGLRVLLRPGPHINAELLHFGFPERIVGDPEIQARTAQDTPAWLMLPPRSFPVPSYASRKFFAEVELWFDEFARVLEGTLYPAGPVVGIQVDNEIGFFFRTGPFDLDYAPDALAAWRAWLRLRYGADEAALGAAWGSAAATFERAEAPRRFDAAGREGLARQLDWAAWRDAYLRDALARLGGMLRARGLGRVPLFHNFPPSEGQPPMDIPGTEAVLDLAGVDLYHLQGEMRAVKRRVLTLAGSSRLPYVPELQSGGWLWWVPLGAQDRSTTALCALMHGVRAANFYMVVERERWFGAPISAEGALRDADADWFKRFNAALKKTEAWSLRRFARVALVCPRLYRQMADFTDLLAPLSPFVSSQFLRERARCRDDTLGFARAPQIVGPELFSQLAAGLDGAGVPYEIVDSGAAAAGALERYDVVLCPTLEPIEAALWKALLARAEAGGVVVIGPDVPRVDERLAPLQLPLRAGEPRAVGFGTAAAFPAGAGEVWVLAPESADLAAAAVAVTSALGAERPRVLPPVRSTTPPVEASCLCDAAGAVRSVFLANPSAEPAGVRLAIEPGAVDGGLVDALGGEAVDLAALRLDAWEVRWLVPREEPSA